MCADTFPKNVLPGNYLHNLYYERLDYQTGARKPKITKVSENVLRLESVQIKGGNNLR